MENRKVKFKPEVFRTQLESVRALRQELAIKEKELADQKWVFEQFLQSPTWRFTVSGSLGGEPATPVLENVRPAFQRIDG